jgi:DNA polymerase-3 subunit epsilon
MAKRVVVVDTETTGFSPVSDRILELAALEVAPRTGAIGRTLHEVVDPERPIPGVVSRIHGIRAADVRGKPRFAAVAGAFCEFVRGAVLLAHNRSFDERMLDAELDRAGFPMLAELGVDFVDSLALSRQAFPLAGKHSLDSVCERLGIDCSGRATHGALVDAKLVAGTLPEFARAFDAWNASDDEFDAVGADRVRRALALVEEVAFGRGSAHPEGAEALLERAAELLAWARPLHAHYEAGVSAAIGESGWCGKSVYAKPVARTGVGWGAAAAGLLDPAILAAYESETTYQKIRALPAGAMTAELERAGALVAAADSCSLSAAASLERLLARTLSVASARKQAARRTLLDAIGAEGYTPQRVQIEHCRSRRTDFRRALRDHAPDADCGPYATVSRTVEIGERDLRSFAALFAEDAQLALC